MDKVLSFGVEGFSVLEEFSDSQLAVVEIYVCHDGNNLHNLPIDLGVLKKAKKTLQNKFLVAGYDGEDFEGHEPDEQIVGFFPESSKMTFRKREGKTYLVAQAIMSKVYAKWAYDVFVEDNDRAVSMEISVLETEVNEDDGLEHITSFVFNGVTLLGKTHMPACEGANASIIKFSKENALQVYSKHFDKNSDRIKKNFVDNMSLAEISGKEESNNMEQEKDVVTEVSNEEIVTPEVVEEEVNVDGAETVEGEFEDKEDKSDEDTYMEEDKESDKDDDADEDKEDEDEDDDKETKNKDFESLTNEQKYEVFRSAVRETLNGCGYLESFDDEYLYVYDYCEGYTYRYAYSLEGTSCTMNADSKERVMRGGYILFTADETEEGTEVSEEVEAEDTKDSEMEALKTENCELKEKVAAYETEQKDKAVEGILSKVVDVLSADKIAELRDEAVNYSLDTLTVFENEVKALAFEAMSVNTKSSKYGFERMPINVEITKTSKYGW